MIGYQFEQDRLGHLAKDSGGNRGELIANPLFMVGV